LDQPLTGNLKYQPRNTVYLIPPSVENGFDGVGSGHFDVHGAIEEKA
jgi:hypothetical protein